MQATLNVSTEVVSSIIGRSLSPSYEIRWRKQALRERLLYIMNKSIGDAVGIVLSTTFGALFAAWFQSAIGLSPTDINNELISPLANLVAILIITIISVGTLFTLFRVIGKGTSRVGKLGWLGRILQARILSYITLMTFGAFLGAVMGIVFASFQFSQSIKVVTICMLAVLISVMKYANIT